MKMSHRASLRLIHCKLLWMRIISHQIKISWDKRSITWNPWNRKLWVWKCRRRTNSIKHLLNNLNSVKRINLLVHSCSQLLIQINSNQQINYTPKLIWMFQMPSWITCHLNTWKTYNLTFRKIQISLLKIIWISIQC